MGKKKKALLKYKRLGTISKKLEKKFANFLQANLDTITTKVEAAVEKIEEIIDTAKEEVLIQVEEPTPEPVVEEKPKTTRKRRTTTKKTATTTKKPASTTRRRRTTKTKTDA